MVPVDATVAGSAAPDLGQPPVQIILPLGTSSFTLADADLAAPNLQFILTSSDETNFSQLIDTTVVQTAASTSQTYPVDHELEHLKEQLNKIASIPSRTETSETLTDDPGHWEAAPEAAANLLVHPHVEPADPDSHRAPTPGETLIVDEDEGKRFSHETLELLVEVRCAQYC